MFKRSVGASCLALILTLTVASAAWGQTKSTKHHGGNTGEQVWLMSAQERLPAAIAQYGSLLEESARAHGLQSHWLAEVMMIESNGNEHARGGLMQMTSIARKFVTKEFGFTCDYHLASCQIEAAALVFSYSYQQTGSVPLAFIAYNRGLAGAAHANVDTNKYWWKARNLTPWAVLTIHPLGQPAVLVATNNAADAVAIEPAVSVQPAQN
jgi:hypothetical protein